MNIHTKAMWPQSTNNSLKRMSESSDFLPANRSAIAEDSTWSVWVGFDGSFCIYDNVLKYTNMGCSRAFLNSLEKFNG